MGSSPSWSWQTVDWTRVRAKGPGRAAVKRINDRFGHLTGDEVLRKSAALVKGQLRSSDILARYGGEEFVILLPQTAIHHARDIAERIRAAVAAQGFKTLAGETLAVTISIGVSSLAVDSSEKDRSVLAEKLIAGADQALYEAKEGGRNRVVCDLAPPPNQSSWEWLCRNAMELVGRAAH